MSERGTYVVIEGIDGTGKTELATRLVTPLLGRKHSVSIFHEPADRFLRAQFARLAKVDSVAAALCYTVDRTLLRPSIESALEQGDIVIQDRSYYSTLAYQADRLEPRERSALRRLQREVSVEPDRVLWLDVPVETALARVHRRGAPLAPLERRANLERVRRAYVRLARPPRWVRLDASAAPEPLARVAEARIRPWLDRRLRRPGARK